MATKILHYVSSQFPTIFQSTAKANTTSNSFSDATTQSVLFQGDVAFSGGSMLFSSGQTKGPPTLNSRSTGTRVVCHANIGSSQVDKAIGVDTNDFYVSTNDTFSIYNNITKIATFTNTMFKTLTTTATASNSVSVQGSFWNTGDFVEQGSIFFSNSSAGAIPSSSTTRSTGSRIVLAPNLSGYETAFGILSNNGLWMSSPTTIQCYTSSGNNTLTIASTGVSVPVSTTVTSNSYSGSSSSVSLYSGGDVGLASNMSLFFSVTPALPSLARSTGQCIKLGSNGTIGLASNGVWIQSGTTTDVYTSTTKTMTIGTTTSVLSQNGSKLIPINPSENDVIVQQKYTTATLPQTLTNITGLVFDPTTFRWGTVNIVFKITFNDNTNLFTQYELQVLQTDSGFDYIPPDENFDNNDTISTSWNVTAGGQVQLSILPINNFSSLELTWRVRTISI